MKIVKHEGGMESLEKLKIEARKATESYIKNYRKSSYSKGREGSIYLVDGTPHVLLEDNENRGLFQSIGKTTEKMNIIPTTIARFADTQKISGAMPNKPTVFSGKRNPVDFAAKSLHKKR